MSEALLAKYAVTVLGQLIFNMLIGVFIAWFLGRKRIIGFGWSFFFCCLNFLFGLIITWMSPIYQSADLSPSTLRKVLGWLMILFGALGFWGVIYAIATGRNTESLGGSLVLVPALIGGGIYLIKRSSGKSFHSRNL